MDSTTKVSSLTPDRDYEATFTMGDVDKTIQFAFCRNIGLQCDNRDSSAAVWWTEDETDKCALLSGADNPAEQPDMVFHNGTDGNSGHMELTFQSTDVCISADPENDVDEQLYSVTYDITCDKDQSEPVFTVIPTSIQTNDCHPKIQVQSKHGCAVLDVNGLWRWAENNYWIIAIVMIVVGLFELVIGQKLIKPTIFILTAGGILGAVLVFFYAIVLPTSAASWLVWLLGGIGLVLGLIAGFFMVKLIRVGVGLLGGWVGVIAALLIHEAFMYTTHQRWIFWIMVVGMGLVFAFVAFWRYKDVQVIGTCVVGAYMAVRGASLFIGGYPNEFTLIDDIKNGDRGNFSWKFYLYLGFMVAVFLAGMVTVLSFYH